MQSVEVLNMKEVSDSIANMAKDKVEDNMYLDIVNVLTNTISEKNDKIIRLKRKIKKLKEKKNFFKVRYDIAMKAQKYGSSYNILPVYQNAEIVKKGGKDPENMGLDDKETTGSTTVWKNSVVMECFNNLIRYGSKKYHIEITPISGYDDADEVSANFIIGEECMTNAVKAIDDGIKLADGGDDECV